MMAIHCLLFDYEHKYESDWEENMEWAEWRFDHQDFAPMVQREDPLLHPFAESFNILISIIFDVYHRKNEMNDDELYMVACSKNKNILAIILF